MSPELRLMKKLGFYLVGVGAFFFSTGIVSAGNPILLLIGNAFFLAGKSRDCDVGTWVVGVVIMKAKMK